MFGLGPLVSTWLLSFSFQNERLQGAVELYEEGQALLAKSDELNKHREACDLWMQGIFMGRTVVQQLQQREEGGDLGDDDPQQAMQWLVASYIACCRARIELKDFATARGDAWAACTFSQNSDWDALECMLTVCHETKDVMGEWQTCKSLLKILLQTPELSSSSESKAKFSVEQVQDRMEALEQELKRNLNS